jgi:uncharacterized repeat protein (TIGR01451 family)
LIEVLNFTDKADKGTRGFQNQVNSYKNCTLPGTPFPGPEVVYKVVLHKGNKDVGFQLKFPAGCKLLMALVSKCSCFRHSPGGVTGFEAIPPEPYEEGTYYLHIDSILPGTCPSYELTATGYNPTPDLVLDLTAPKSVFAGENLVYTMKVSNVGKLDATNVQLTPVLPDGVTYKYKPGTGCTTTAKPLVCTIPRLAQKDSATVTVTVSVNSDIVKDNKAVKLISSAKATANEGDPSSEDNADKTETTVQAKSDLSITNSSPKTAVAGKSMTYTLTLANAGPSDASTKVQVTAPSLPSGMTFASGSPGCSKQGSGFICTIDRLKPKVPPTTITITATIKPDAVVGPTSHTASVRAVESDPTPNNTTTITTEVRRLTDLAITKTGPNKRAAGDTLSYQISVENKGPSDSTKATVTDDLPLGLTFSLPSNCNASANKVTCEIFGLQAGKSTTVTFDTLIDSSLNPTTLVNKASVQARDKDFDPNGDNNTSKPSVETQVTVEADLLLQSVIATRIPWLGVDPAGTVKAGENLLYTVKVSNSGPSDFRGGYIQDVLPEGLTFVSSPDGCSLAGLAVNCPVPGLKKGEEVVRRFVVGIASSVTEPIKNEICAKSSSAGHDLHGENDCTSDTIRVEREADLSVTLTDSPDAVLVSTDLTYTLSVKNAGPSNATAVIVDLTLPPGAHVGDSPDFPPGCYERQADPGVVRCDLGDIVARDTESRMIKVLAPSERGAFVAKADVHANTTDPGATNNHVEETTTVATGEDVDLVLTKTVDATAAVVGQLLRYELTLANQGFAGTGEVALSVDDTLPEGVTFEQSESSPACMDTGTGILCGFDRLDPHTKQTRDLTVRVESIGTGSLLNTADISQSTVEAVPDPNPRNNHASVEVPVLKTAPLVLPFAEVNADTSNPTMLFTLKNPSETLISVLYDVFLTGSSPVTIPRSIDLGPNSTKTVNLFADLQGKHGLQVGYVGITPMPGEDALAGDFIHFDPSQGSASGERLISTDTSRTPPELCESWSVRFLRGLPAGSSTDLLFFVPGNSGGVIATGKVFAESGAFVQNVEAISDKEAFRVTINAQDDGGLPLLAGSGSIEWTFRKGLVGNVTAVHKLGGKDEIAVPGFCRATRRDGGSSLLLPFFEVDRSRDVGLTTLLAFRNETDETVTVQPAVHFQEAGTSKEQKTEAFILDGHQTQTLNLRDVLKKLGLDSVSQGYVTLEAAPPAVLSGDFIRVGPEGRSGAALVSSQLCRYWDVRFVQGTPAGSETRFLFYLQDGGAPTGTAYNEGGQFLSDISIPNPTFPSFLAAASGLGLSGSGSVEWNLGDGATGYVAMLLTGKGPGGNYSVLIPGACRRP